MITLTINDKLIKLDRPMSVLDAAEQNGIYIPHFCDHPLIEKFGGCRMCLVEVEKMPRLQASCTLKTTEGMIVKTESPAVVKARKAVLEFLLINHPLDCPKCDKAHECTLQDYTLVYGPAAGRFEEKKRLEPESVKDPLIVRNMERCILCTRCVRMCDGVQGASAIAVVDRGKDAVIEPFDKNRFDCDYCGNCITVCPVGSLMSKMHRYKYRPWETEREVRTTCPHCGVGCSLLMQVREDRLQRAVPEVGIGPGSGILCARGYFGYDHMESKDRVAEPMIRKKGKLAPVSWDEALDFVADNLKNTMLKHGGGSIAAMASAYCANEENYLLQKIMRTGLNSNNIDSVSRMGLAGARRLLESVLGAGATANPISAISDSKAVLVVGGDPTVISPVLGVKIRNAFNKGAQVITAGAMPGLKRHHAIALNSGSESSVLASLLSAITKQHNLPYGNNELRAFIESLDMSGFGIDADTAKAAEILAGAGGSASIVISPDVLNYEGGTTVLMLTASLAYAIGARVYLLSSRPNENGLLDMGCEPDRLPGGREFLENAATRMQYEEAWGLPVCMTKGKTLFEFMDDACKGNLKAMYVMGANPIESLPDTEHTKQALFALDFLIVQDGFMTETAKAAHVVLPASGWGEKDGTYTNLERRILMLRQGVKSAGNSMPDWRILTEIANRLGLRYDYKSPSDIFDEITKVSPMHKKLSYADIEKGEHDAWPHKSKPEAAGRFPSDVKIELQAPSLKLRLLYEKSLFVSSTLGRHSSSLLSIYKGPFAMMNESTAKAYSLYEGNTVIISTGAGKAYYKAKIDECMPDNAVMVQDNGRLYGFKGLMVYNIEPSTKAPVFSATKTELSKG